MNVKNNDIFWMKRTINIAKKAFLKNKSPIGSILVWNNFEIGIGFNFKQFNYYSITHAEINTLKQASFYCSNRILTESIIYITLEPCIICLTSILLFKIKKIVFGSYCKNKNPKTIINYKNKIKIVGGILKNECDNLLKNFYSQKLS